MKLPYVYLPFQVRSRHLRSLIKVMKLMDVEGVNVTAPHKVAVCRWLDSLSPDAHRLGAVNTILLRNGRSVGFNTDRQAFFDMLPRIGGGAGKRGVVLGTGGAARAVVDAMIDKGMDKVIVFGRGPTRMRGLKRWLRVSKGDVPVSVLPWNRRALRTALLDCDLVVQATSAPRNGKDALRWPARTDVARIWAVDLRYGKGGSEWLRGAKKSGARCMDGTELLVRQAALSFKIWTGKTPDLTYMRRRVRYLLR